MSTPHGPSPELPADFRSGVPAGAIVIGPYLALDEVGRGAMGTVLRARAPDGGIVAVKLLQNVRAELVKRFDRERRLQTELGEAAGFVPLLDAGTSPLGPYLVMPLLTGGTLHDRLGRGGPLPVAHAVALGRRLAWALSGAHARGIVHRDLKPANVLFDGSGRALVTDLGLAKHIHGSLDRGETGTASLSRSGELKGTFGYMAPEQMRDAKTVDASADVYALGMILYQCLTGRVAHRATQPLELLIQVTEGRIEPIAAVRDDVPRWLERLIRRCIDPDRARRPRDAAELLAALDAGEAGDDGEGAGALGSRLAIAGAVAVGAVFAAVGAVAVVLSVRGSEVPDRPRGGVVAVTSPSASGATGVVPTAASAAPDHESDAQLRRPTGAPDPGVAAQALADHQALAGDAALTLRAVWGRRRHKVAGPPGRLVPAGDDRRVLVTMPPRSGVVLEAGLPSAGFSGAPGPFGVAAGLTPEGRTLFFAGRQGLIVFPVGAPPTGSPIPNPAEPVRAAALLSGGRLALTGGEAGELLVWDLPRGTSEPLGRLEGPVDGLHLSADGRRLLACSAGELQLWDLVGRTPVARFAVESAVAAISGDGRWVASLAAEVGAVDLWRVDRPDVPAASVVSSDRPLRGIALSPDGDRLAVAGDEGLVRIHDVPSGERTLELVGHVGAVTACAFSADGRRLVTGGADHTVRRWDLDEGGVELDPPPGSPGPVHGLAFLDGELAVTAGIDRALRVWDVETDAEVGLVEGGPFRRVAVGGGRWVIGVDAEGGSARVIDLTGGDEPRTLQGPEGLEAVAISADGRRAVTGGAANAVVIWDLTTGERTEIASRQPTREGTVRAIAFAPGDDRLATVTSKGKISIFDVATGELLAWDIIIDAVMTSVACFDAETVFVGVQSGVLVAKPEADHAMGPFHAEADVRAVAFDGRRSRVAVAAAGAVVVKDVEGERVVGRLDFSRAMQTPTSVALSPDGRRLLVGTDHGTVLRYDVVD